MLFCKKVGRAEAVGLAGALRLQPTTNPSHQEPPPLLLQNHHPLRFQLHQRELGMKENDNLAAGL